MRLRKGDDEVVDARFEESRHAQETWKLFPHPCHRTFLNLGLVFESLDWQLSLRLLGEEHSVEN